MPESTAAQSKGRPGRKRDLDLRRRILDTTLELLQSEGYAEININRVATHAGVSRPTIYRWWESKAELVHAAVFDDHPRLPEIDTGDLASDVRALIRGLITGLRRPGVIDYFRGAVADWNSDTSVQARVMARQQAGIARCRRVFESATRRGEVRADFDVEGFYFLLYGGVQVWMLFGPAISGRKLEERLFRLAWASVEKFK